MSHYLLASHSDVTAIIEREKSYFMIQEPSGLWNFPRARIQGNYRFGLETAILEDFGMSIEAGSTLHSGRKPFLQDMFRLTAVVHCIYLQGEVNKDDLPSHVKDVAWVKPHEMLLYDISKANMPFVETLKRREKGL